MGKFTARHIKQLKFTSAIYVLLTFVLLIAYNNCSSGDYRSPASLAGQFGSGTCDEIVIRKYESVVYPFFRSDSTCLSCHVEGGQGLGVFASPDVQTSFAAFMGAGITKIEYMATNPGHKPPYTGIHNRPAMDAIVPKWLRAEREHLECVTKSENGGVNDSMLTSAKKAPSIYSGENASEVLSWDLDLASDLDEKVTRSIPARISVTIKVLYHVSEGQRYAKGYIFSNPTLQLKDDKQQVVIEGLFFQINRRPISSQTTFTSLSRVISGTTETLLMRADANTLIEPLSTQDEFQLYLRRIVPTSGTDTSPAPLTPILHVSDKTTKLNTHIREREADLFILRDAGIVRWCVSESPTRPESTESACASGMTGDNIVNGWHLSRPTRFTFSAGDGPKKLYLWVANENLKINESAAQATIELDTTAPQAASIGAITVTDTQVAPLAVSHPNEADIKGWCLIEQSNVKAAPEKPKLDDVCWRWTDNNAKPTTVGFKSGGNRDVWVFVRDLAGNISLPSNKQSAFNSHGAITFSKLIERTGDPRSVIGNRCFACHGSNQNPGFSKLQLFDYGEAIQVSRSGLLVARTNNPLSPMPNTEQGLMPQRERDLIRLWTLPESGNEPLP